MVNERGWPQLVHFQSMSSDLLADNRPVPKPHFAALQPAAPKYAPAVLPTLAAPSGSSSNGRPSLAPVSRPSSSTGSRVPRPSVGGFGGTSRLSQVLHQPAPAPVAKTVALTDKEIDERVSGMWHPARMYAKRMKRSRGPWKLKWPGGWRSANESGHEKKRHVVKKTLDGGRKPGEQRSGRERSQLPKNRSPLARSPHYYVAKKIWTVAHSRNAWRSSSRSCKSVRTAEHWVLGANIVQRQ